MIKENSIIDIDDFGQELKDLYKLIDSIQSNFQAIVFDYGNKVSIKIDNPVITVRTDLLFKIYSIIYFVKLMNKEELAVLDYLNNHNNSHDFNRMRISDELIHNQKSIFDTILYHLSSVYDYYAKMCGQIYLGKVLKWNGLYKMANDLKNIKMGVQQKELIIHSHKEFVNSLFSHRSYLIHESMEHPSFQYKNNLMTDEHIVKAFTPKKFIKEFKNLYEHVGDNKITLTAAMLWTLKFGLKNINSLLFGMKDELESLRKIKKGNEIIKDIRFPHEDVSVTYWKKE